MTSATGMSSSSPVIVCSTEQEYHTAITNAGDKLVVVDCYADWYVFVELYKLRDFMISIGMFYLSFFQSLFETKFMMMMMMMYICI